MSSDLALSVREVSKRYTLTQRGQRYSTLTEQILHTMRHPFQRNAREAFWALHDINFEVKQGEVVGIIGRNGAGKSTLLKILSQITEPTNGVIDIYGHVGSLLEVGTGFHPELTGRENIFLNGAILGMRRRDIQRQFDAIVDFAGVDRFLDTPVKRYSSGMYIRLAFAVAAHLNPEILVVDEVLAVGDAEFQNKCLGKMREVSRGQGRTVLFVSHNVAAVRQLCTQAIYLVTGKLIRQGPTEAVLDLYAAARQTAAAASHDHNEHGVALIDIGLFDAETGQRTERPTFARDYRLQVHLNLQRPIGLGSVYVRIYDDAGNKITSLGSIEEGLLPFTMKDDVRIEFSLPRLPLLPAGYTVNVEVARPNDPMRYLYAEDVLQFEVQPAILADSMWAYDRSQGMVRVAESAQVIS